MTICLDLDGVFADFNTAYGDLLIKVSGVDLLPSGWRTNADFPQTWFWERDAGYSAEVEKTVWEQHILKKGSKFWQTLAPLPGAREALSGLNNLQKQGHQVWFISNRIGDLGHFQTLKWLYENGLDYPQLVLARDKIPYLRLLETNVFIDDKPQTVQEVARVADEECWKNFSLFLQAAPYNKTIWGDGRFQTVKSVKEMLLKLGLWS